MKNKIICSVCAAFSALAVTAFTSCSYLSTDLKGYLKEYTETAAVEEYSLDGVYQKDNTGTYCLPSGNSRKITFYLRNPQNYVLTITPSFPSAAAAACALLQSSNSTPYSVYQDTADSSIVYAVFSNEMITALDKGGDITITLALTEPKSQRVFASYTLPLKANTPPPQADGTVIMVSSGNKYIVCFNMPPKAKMKSSGIHSDIVKITIDGKEYPITVDGTEGTFAFSASPENLTQTEPSGITSNNTYGSGLTFAVRGQPVYYLTSDTLSEENKTYAISVTDSAGLVSTVKTSVQSAQLGSVYMTDSEGNKITAGQTLAQDEDSSYCTVKLCPPETSADKNGVMQNTSDAVILYEVYKGSDENGSLLFADESTGGKVSLKLPAGNIYIKAYARKLMWVDSDVYTNADKVTAARVFVNPAFTGTSTGSSDYPFTTISAAFSALDDKTSSANTITLLGNVTENIDLSDTTIYTAPAYTAAIKSDTAAASADQNTTLHGTVVITGGSSLGFKNITLNGGHTSDTTGAAVTVNENAVLTVDGTTRVSGGYVYLDNDVQTGNTQGAIVTGSSFSVSDIDVSKNKYALLIKPATYTNSVLTSLVEVTDSSGTLAQTTANALAVQDNGTDSYYISSLNGKGYITLRGSFVSVAFGSDYSTVTLNEIVSSYTAGSGLTVTLGTAVPSGTVITAVTVNRLDGKAVATVTVASGGQSAAVTLPSSPAVYELYVTGTVPYGSGTMTWSASKEITVVYGTSE